MPEYLKELPGVVESEVAPNASQVDTEGRFPRANIDALKRAGLLGLTSAESVGGMGAGVRAATDAVGELARHCASTAMIVCMHYAATAVIEAHGSDEIRTAIAANRHVSTLAFSEKGSRSQFWAPMSTATGIGDMVALDAEKSWITGAGEADSYVWSSRPLRADGASTLWFVPSDTCGLKVDGPFDGLGLRGNGSSPVSATAATISRSSMLGVDGGGFDVMMGTVLPWFNLMNAAMSVGLMDTSITAAARHVGASRLEHLDETLADNPVNRLHLARARVTADAAAALVERAVTAVEAGADDAMLGVLEAKAAAGDAAIDVTDACMRVCGGAAFRKEVGVERNFRDARAAAVMAPTSDVLYDFVGKAICGMPLF